MKGCPPYSFFEAYTVVALAVAAAVVSGMPWVTLSWLAEFGLPWGQRG